MFMSSGGSKSLIAGPGRNASHQGHQSYPAKLEQAITRIFLHGDRNARAEEPTSVQLERRVTRVISEARNRLECGRRVALLGRRRLWVSCVAERFCTYR